MKNENTKQGKVLEALPNGQFKVEVDGKEGRYYSSGKIRIKKIKIVVGDTVEVVIPEQGEIGRIIWRK